MPKYYTINEAAEILRMNPESVRLMIVEHKLEPSERGKGKYLITEKQIEASWYLWVRLETKQANHLNKNMTVLSNLF